MIELDDLFGTDSPAPVASTVIECPPPGVYHNVPAHEYHQWAAISSTLLKGYAKLPSTARIPYVPGDDANMGSGIHAYSLQGLEGLEAECFFIPASCEGKSAKALAEREEYKLTQGGKALLPPVYGPDKILAMEVLTGVDTSLHSHPKVGPVLRNSQKEVSVVWIDEDSGCLCKARFDIWDGAIIWDLKKCRSISGFPWQIKDLNYDIQAGHYFNGAVACGLNPVAFGFIPIEAFPPYQVAWGYRNPDKLPLDCINARRIIGLVKQSQLTGNWPNFPIPENIFDLDDLTPDDTAQDY
jgi:hypothetical protein